MADEFRKLTDERVRDGAARVTLIERSILMLLVVGLLIGVLAIVKPFTTAILFGASLATAAWPIRQALVRRGLGHGPAAALLLLLSLVIVVLPMLAFAPHLADQMVRGTQRVQSYFAATPEQPAWIKSVPLLGRRLGLAWDRIVEVKGNLRALLEPYTAHLERDPSATAQMIDVKGGIYFCPMWPPKSLVPEEFVIDPAPAPFGGVLDPWATMVSPMSASAVC
jgi:Zn-dependent protease with chaperone function